MNEQTQQHEDGTRCNHEERWMVILRVGRQSRHECWLPNRLTPYVSVTPSVPCGCTGAVVNESTVGGGTVEQLSGPGHQGKGVPTVGELCAHMMKMHASMHVEHSPPMREDVSRQDVRQQEEAVGHCTCAKDTKSERSLNSSLPVPL